MYPKRKNPLPCRPAAGWNIKTRASRPVKERELGCLERNSRQPEDAEDNLSTHRSSNSDLGEVPRPMEGEGGEQGLVDNKSHPVRFSDPHGREPAASRV